MLADPVGGSQSCRDWGAGGQFKVCEIACKPGLRFSQQVPPFYTCGAEGFWRPTPDPSLQMLYPACSREYYELKNTQYICIRLYVHNIRFYFNISASTPAQRVFKVSMLFPSSVLCNEAGQGVLRQKVRNAVNQLNRDWNFCSYFIDGKF